MVPNEIIANVQEGNPNIPMISINFAGMELMVLIDTGSSISLLSNDFFNAHKEILKYRHLSRRVKISTINSTVSFQGCIDISFKIQKLNFRHNMYLFNFNSGSQFHALLGFDFIQKFNLILFPELGLCKIGQEIIHFSNMNNSNKVNNCISSESDNVNDHVEFSQDIDSRAINNNISLDANADPYVPMNINNSNMHNVVSDDYPFNVFVHEQVILAPNDACFIKVHVSLPSSLPDNRFIFLPSVAQSVFHESVHSLCCEDIAQCDDENTEYDLFIFHVYANNNSNNTLTIHCNDVCGSLFEIDHIDEQTLKSHPIDPVPDVHEVINLIIPSEEVISARQQEFKNANVNLDHLPSHQQQQLKETLSTNFSAFSATLKTMGHSDRIVPNIKFTSDYPIKSLPFPIPQSLQAEAKRQLEEMEHAGIITRNIASWSCPMLLVKKKVRDDGVQTYRMALDLRLINTVIEHSSYPLPKINQIIHDLAQFSFFTALDMPAAYHQLELPEQVRDRLSFTTPWSTYRCNRLPFGLKTSSASFQALLDSIVAEVNMPGIFVYQDDIFIGTNSFEETLTRLNKFLQVFAKYNLTLNLNKCSFHQTEINCLGFKISQQKILPITANIKKITAFPVPTTKRQLKRFLGVCGFYRNLIPKYAHVSDPLVKLTSPKVPFEWNEDHQYAFDSLQKIFFNAPFLRQPVFNEPFYFNTDASNVAISAVLLQKHNGHLLPVSYFSRTLKKSEKNYPAIQLELMAIVKGVQAFKNILYGRKFEIISDAAPLEHYKKTTSPADIITRWLIQLSEYTFEFQPIAGETNVLADYLSRTDFSDNTIDILSDPSIVQSTQILPVYDQENSDNSNLNVEVCHNINNDITSNVPTEVKDNSFEISEPVLKSEQSNDRFISRTIADIKKNKCRNKNFIICPHTGLLLFSNSNSHNDPPKVKIVIPVSLQEKCLKLFHFPHFGITKTYEKCSDIYYWKGMYNDVVNYVNACDVCAQSKHHNIPKAPLQDNPIPTRPGEFISMDFVGPFSNSKFILTVVDHFSKHLHLYILNNITAMNTVKAVFDYFSIFGKPKLVLTDNGKQFTAQMFKEFQHMLGVKLKKTSIYHPETNAVSERLNTSIKATIKALMKDGYTFDNAVKIHQSLYNSTFHSTIKTSPNEVHFGRKLNGLVDAFVPIDPAARLDVPADYYNIIENLNKLYKQIEENLKNFQRLQNNKQQPKSKLRSFKVHDTVYMQQKGKINTIYRGPFTVVKKCSEVTYKIQLSEDDSSPWLTVHVNKLITAPPSKRDVVTFPNNRPLGRLDEQSPNRLQYNPTIKSSNYTASAEVFQTVPLVQNTDLYNSVPLQHNTSLCGESVPHIVSKSTPDELLPGLFNPSTSVISESSTVADDAEIQQFLINHPSPPQLDLYNNEDVDSQVLSTSDNSLQPPQLEYYGNDQPVQPIIQNNAELSSPISINSNFSFSNVCSPTSINMSPSLNVPSPPYLLRSQVRVKT